MAKSRIFLFFCISFILGIFLGSITIISQLAVLGFLILGIFLISIFWQNKKLVIIGFSILFLALGFLRYQFEELKTINNNLKEYVQKEQKIILTGIINNDPEIEQNSIKFILKTEKLTINSQKLLVLEKVFINSGRYPEYQYGDKIKVQGFLKNPSQDINGFNYKNYLKKEGIYSIMSWPKIELIERGFGNPLMEKLFSFKNKFKEASRRFLSLPQEGLLEALVFGDETNISDSLKEKFNLTGTRHIMAVSGMNITIISSLILSFVLSLGMWRRHAFYITVLLLFFYIFMIGAPASAIRAGIMAFFFLLAQRLGRISSAGRAIVFAATLMLFQNPFLLTLDIGFQLSFLAILGMVYIQPIFLNWLYKIPDFKFFPLKNALTATLSAQIFTLPILIYNFGYISLVAPFSNIMIVPFLAPITILVFIFGLSAVLFWPLAFILSWPAWLFLTYIIAVIEYFSKIPLARLSLNNFSLIWLIVFYLFLFFLTWRLDKKYKTPAFLR